MSEPVETREWKDELAHWRERTYSRGGGSTTIISAVCDGRKFSVTFMSGVGTSNDERRLRDELRREVAVYAAGKAARK